MHFEDFCLGAVHSCHVSGAKKGPQLTRLFTREYVLLYIYIYTYIYIYVYIYIYICIKYIFIYIYIYTHTYHLSSHRDAVELHSLFHTCFIQQDMCRPRCTSEVPRGRSSSSSSGFTAIIYCGSCMSISLVL